MTFFSRALRLLDYDHLQRTMTADFRTRVIRGSFWSLVGLAAIRGSGFLSSILVIRVLGKEGYGELAMYQATVELFGVFVGLGLGTTATKLIAQHRALDPVRAGRILTLLLIVAGIAGLFGGFVVIGSANWLATSVLERPSLATLLVWGGIGMLFSIVSGVQGGALVGLEAFKALARLSAILGLITPAMVIPMVLIAGQVGVVTAGIASGAANLLMGRRALRLECSRLGIKLSYEPLIWSEFRGALKFALPVFIATLTVMPVTWLCNKILVGQPGGYSELGKLNASQQFRVAFTTIQNAFGPVMFPIMAESHSNEDRFFHSTQFSAKITLLLGVPVAVLLVVFSEHLTILYGTDFADISPLISIMAVVSLLNLYNGTIGMALVAAGRTWQGVFSNLAWATITIGVAFALIPIYGALGLAIGYLVGYAAHTIIQLIYLEITVAPGSIAGQARLGAFSIGALSLATVLVLTSMANAIYQCIVVAFSATPIIVALVRAKQGAPTA